MRISFDTNVLIYAADFRADERHAQAARLLARAGRCDALLTLQALGEFLNVVMRKARIAPARAIGFV